VFTDRKVLAAIAISETQTFHAKSVRNSLPTLPAYSAVATGVGSRNTPRGRRE
jgi:hypothetical protein